MFKENDLIMNEFQFAYVQVNVMFRKSTLMNSIFIKSVLMYMFSIILYKTFRH